MTIHYSVVAVPARIKSSRLPTKVLPDIAGSMIRRGLERCRKVSSVLAVLLCTDSARLQELPNGWGFQVLTISPDFISCSVRTPSVAELLM